MPGLSINWGPWADDGMVRVWNATSGEEIAKFDHAGPVRGVAWHADTRQLMAWARPSDHKVIEKAVAEVETPIELRKVEKLSEIMAFGVMSTPAARMTLIASAVTSGPIPSPPITAMLCAIGAAA